MGSVETRPLFLRVLPPVLESGVQALVIATLAWLKPQETGVCGLDGQNEDTREP